MVNLLRLLLLSAECRRRLSKPESASVPRAIIINIRPGIQHYYSAQIGRPFSHRLASIGGIDNPAARRP
ncbi:hypothetical protein C2U68_09510 [Methylomonas koyamae]|nr:hypothetical protein C2U68_09510 [Methylomonas koyamae]